MQLSSVGFNFLYDGSVDMKISAVLTRNQCRLTVTRMTVTPLLMCSECVSLSVNFYRKSEGVRMRGHETSSSAQRDVHEFLSFSHRKWMLLD